MPTPVRMIALDLDGTLLNSDGRVSPRNLAALAAAQQAGMVLAIATGRRHSYALKVISELGLHPDTLVVSSNGAVVRTVASTLIERTHMDRDAALRLCALLAEFRNALVITFDKVGTAGEDLRGTLVVEELADLHGSIDRWMTANAPYIARVQPIELALAPGLEPPIQMMVCGTVERMRRAEARMLESPEVSAVGETRRGGTVSLNRTEYPERDLSIVDILPAGCSKGAALLRLAAARGLEPASLLCIGDNYNDLSMLEVAGHSVLMANAPGDLLATARERGWLITSSNDADGVAMAIEPHLPSLLSRKEDDRSASPISTTSSNELVGSHQ